MDITGYRGRATPILRASYDPKRKPPKHATTSLATRAILLLLFLLASWGAVHRLQRRSAPAAATGKARGSSGAAADGIESAAAATAADAAREARIEALAAARAERAMRIVPQYRGPGKVETFPHFSNANRLLLATHGRLMWYRYDTDQVTLLHEGQVGLGSSALPPALRPVQLAQPALGSLVEGVAMLLAAAAPGALRFRWLAHSDASATQQPPAHSPLCAVRRVCTTEPSPVPSAACWASPPHCGWCRGPTTGGMLPIPASGFSTCTWRRGESWGGCRHVG